MRISIVLPIFLFVCSIMLFLVSLYYRSQKSDNLDESNSLRKKFYLFLSLSVVLLILAVVIYKYFNSKFYLAKDILSEKDSSLLDSKCQELFSSDPKLKQQYLDFRGTGQMSYETANLCRKYAQTIAGVKV
jgi:hypothetical protein